MVTLSEHRRYLLLTVISCALLLLVTIVYPFAQDQDLYESMAIQLLRFHQLPYVGSWDMNWPGIVLIHSVSILLFGNSITGFRIFDGLMHVGMFSLLFVLLRRWLPSRLAYWSVLTALAFFLFRNQGNSGERDGYVAFVVLMEVFFIYRIKDAVESGTRNKYWYAWQALLLGILSTFSIAIRPTAACYSLTSCIALYMLSPKHRVQWLLYFGAGSALLAFLILTPYAMTPGGIHQMYLSIISFTVDVYASRPKSLPYSQVMFIKTELLVNLVLVVGIAFLLLRYRSHFSVKLGETSQAVHKQVLTKFDIFIFASCYVWSRISIFAMGKYWRYHYELLLILTAIMIAIMIDHVMSSFKSRWVKSNGLPVVTIALLALCYPWSTAKYFAEGCARSTAPIEYARSKFAKEFNHPYLLEQALTQFVKSHTHSGDRIELVSIDPNLYWNVQLQPSSRFTMIQPLAMQKANGGYTLYQEEWRREFLDSLIGTAPKLIILSDSPSVSGNLLFQPPSQLVRNIPGFDQFLNDNYRADTVIFYWTIYRRKGAI